MRLPALILAGLVLLASPVSAQSLPEDAGVETVKRVCSACHDPGVVATQALDKEGWTELVGQMVSNGAVATEAEQAEIVTYLAGHFPK